MKVIYLDNFRGFSKTLIPLKDVNFLVGENSAGKSSVLSIVQAMSEYSFSGIRFNTDEYELGNFDDVVSIAGVKRTHFTIGYAHRYSKKNSKKLDSEFEIITYGNDNGVPYVKKISYLVEAKKVIHACVNEDSLHYSLSEFEIDDVSSFDDFSNWFEKIIKDHDSVKKFPNEIKIEDKSFKQKLPAYSIKSYIADHLSKDPKMKGSPTHYFPHRMSRIYENTIWIAPIRQKPKRIYDDVKPEYSSEGDHIPYILNNRLNSENKDSKEEFINAMEKFGMGSNLFKEVGVKRYGKDSYSPFEINVTLSKKPLRISNVGYGISQVLPIIVESSSIRKYKVCLNIQQPEVHLHPRAQAALGELFFNLAHSEQKEFLIETHSDFLIDRFRLQLKNHKKNKVSSQVLFFERDEKNRNTCSPINIEDDGKYSENQPESFREFFIREQLNMLDL